MSEIASALFNKVLVKVLSSFLTYYMNNFSKESFKLQMLKGTFALADIEVNTQFLKETIVLPNLEITKCLCDKIFIKIPWHHITSEPITFDLDRVELVCEEIPLGSSEDQSGPKKERPTTSYAWAQRMIDGIKMNVGEVDMTMKFNGYRGVPYIKKVKCSGISIYSTDSNWKAVDLKESFVEDKTRSETLFYKVMDCKSLTVSFARADQAEPEFCTFMRDMPVQIRMKVLRDSKTKAVLCGDFQLYLPRADMSFSGQQWKNFMELLKGIVGCFTRTDQEYSLYKDIGKDERVKEKPEKTKSWWEKRKAAKDDKEKTRKLAELELRQKAVADLKSVGADASHLEQIPSETHFRVHIEKGSMNLLEEEDRLTLEPFKYAFGRLFFENMNIDVELPPAMDVPDTNKWTANSRQRLMMQASLKIHNMACVIQENFNSYIDALKSGTHRERKQITILTDGRSEDLQRRINEVKRDLSAAQEEAKGPETVTAETRQAEERKEQEQKGQKDFVSISWAVRSGAPEETNMERWLRSLDCQMTLEVCSNYFVLLHRWWARIIRYLETSSLGADSIEAINLIKMQISVQVDDMVITVPLHGCLQYEVPTAEELEMLPHVVLTSTCMKAGRNVLGELTQLFASHKLPTASFATGGQQISGWRPQRLGHDESGWTLHTHTYKPQRFQLVLENLVMSVGNDRIMSPVTFGMELTLHRFTTTEQLLLELCTHAELIQMHVNRAQYLMYIHFMEYLSTVIWPELELVLLRKYGPSSIQEDLTDQSIVQVAKKQGHMPLAVNTHSFIDYLMLHVNGSPISAESVVNAFFKLDPSERQAVVEMHVEKLLSKSSNAVLFETGKTHKNAKCDKATVHIPSHVATSGAATNEDGEKAKEKEVEIQSSKPLVEVGTLAGNVITEHLHDIVALLKSSNLAAFNALLDVGEGDVEEVIKQESSVVVYRNQIIVDGECAPASLPRPVTSFLEDFVMVRD